MVSATPIPAGVIRYALAACLVLFAFATSTSAQDSTLPSDDLFAESAWHLELGAHGAIEAWNFNFSHEYMFAGTVGVSYGLRRNLALVISAPVYFVAQRGPDAWLFGGTCGVRWRALGRRRVAVFIEGELGISRAQVPTPPRGTQFNYLVLAAGGITMRLARGTHLLTGIKWVHVSNNQLAGRDRNPDIEAVGPRISVIREF